MGNLNSLLMVSPKKFQKPDKPENSKNWNSKSQRDLSNNSKEITKDKTGTISEPVVKQLRPNKSTLIIQSLDASAQPIDPFEKDKVADKRKSTHTLEIQNTN